MAKSIPLQITVCVFSRFTQGKLKDKINPKSSANVTLYNRIDPETGHWESVSDCLGRFKKQTEDAVFKIVNIQEVAA